jgi:hypothetical protein
MLSLGRTMQNSAVTFEQYGVEAETGYTGRHALVPVLIGLTAPVLVLSIIDPRALANASVIFHIYLFLVFVIATGAYIYSVVDPGEITKVVFDKQSRVVTVNRAGLFATSALEIPFSDIAAVRVESRYDDDGYQSHVPMLVLTDHKIVPLPAGTTEQDVATMRALMRRG